jgi:hypothetical protein
MIKLSSSKEVQSFDNEPTLIISRNTSRPLICGIKCRSLVIEPFWRENNKGQNRASVIAERVRKFYADKVGEKTYVRVKECVCVCALVRVCLNWSYVNMKWWCLARVSARKRELCVCVCERERERERAIWCQGKERKCQKAARNVEHEEPHHHELYFLVAIGFCSSIATLAVSRT